MKMTRKEIRYLTMLLMAEFNEKNNRQLHAASHNSDFYDPDIQTCETLIGKVQVEFLELKAINDEKAIDDFSDDS